MALRIAYSILFLLSILFAPILVSIILALLGMIYFDLYLEAPFFLLLSDLLYGVTEVRYYGVPFVSFLGTALVFVVIQLSKKQLKLDKRT
ncbi:MAG: hypothetical protein M3Q34_00795 [bacterium]|nr:hypothetical protein [bacterium]